MDFFDEEAINFNEIFDFLLDKDEKKAKNELKLDKNRITEVTDKALSELKNTAKSNKVHAATKFNKLVVNEMINKYSNLNRSSDTISARAMDLNYSSINKSSYDAFIRDLINKFSKSNFYKNGFYFQCRTYPLSGNFNYGGYIDLIISKEALSPESAKAIEANKSKIINIIKACQNEIIKSINKHNMGKYMDKNTSAEEYYKDILQYFAQHKNAKYYSTELASLSNYPDEIDGKDVYKYYIDKISEELMGNKIINKYAELSDQSVDGDYVFYVEFDRNIFIDKNKDFFDEEAIRLNEGLLHRLNPIADHEFEKAAKLNKKEIDFIVSEARKFEKFMMDTIEDPANGDENGAGTEISYIEKYIRTNYPSPLSSSNYFGFTDSYKVFKKLKDYIEKNKLTKAYNDKNHFYIRLEKNTADQDDGGGSGYAAYCVVDVEWFKNTLKNK